ncbi:hypothetical protein L9F63_025077, partial [Diploptera punctata]
VHKPLRETGTVQPRLRGALLIAKRKNLVQNRRQTITRKVRTMATDTITENSRVPRSKILGPTLRLFSENSRSH